jgi:hypothetical protein
MGVGVVSGFEARRSTSAAFAVRAFLSADHLDGLRIFVGRYDRILFGGSRMPSHKCQGAALDDKIAQVIPQVVGGW